MRRTELSTMSVAEIMNRWPGTIRVFIDLKLRCVGCPIAAFHTIADAAAEHGIAPESLEDLISAAIIAEQGIKEGQVPARLRSSAAGGPPSQGASAARPPPGRPPPRR